MITGIQQKTEHGAVYITHRNSTRTGNIINYNFDNSIQYNRIIFESASFSQTFYNISSVYGNNRISFSVDNAATEIFTLADGFYDTNGLMTLIATALNTGHNYFTYSVTNFKITITITAGHTLRFVRFTSANSSNVQNANKLYDMLGFSSTFAIFSSNLSTSVTGDNPVNLQPITQLLLSSPAFESQFTVQNNDCPFSVPITVEYGHFQSYSRSNDFTS